MEMQRQVPLYDEAKLRNPSFVWIGGDLVVNHLHDHSLTDGSGSLACGRDCKGARLELANSCIAFGMGLWGSMGASVPLDLFPEIVLGSAAGIGL